MSFATIANIFIGSAAGIYVLAIILEYLAGLAQKRALKEQSVVLMVRVARDNETGPLVAEQVFSTIHSVVSDLSLWDRLKGVTPEKVSFEIANIGRSIRFYVQFPARLRNLVEGQVYAQYPNVEIEEIADYSFAPTAEVAQKKVDAAASHGEGRDRQVVVHQPSESLKFASINAYATAVGAELSLTSPDFFPIKSYNQFEDKSTQMNVDALSGITATLAKFSDPDEQAWIQYVISPVSEKRGKYLQKTYEAYSS